MKFLILVATASWLMGCENEATREVANSIEKRGQEEAAILRKKCFDSGGVEYHYGSAGGGWGGLRVCVYKPEETGR